MGFERICSLVLSGVCCVGLSSCDGARKLASKARKVVAGELAQTGSSDVLGGPVDADLQSLVDETPEGIRFRKDLPFPTAVRVKVTSRTDLNSRVFSSSALGKEAQSFNGTIELEMEMTLAASRVTVVTKDTRKVVPPKAGEEKEATKEVLKKGGSITLERRKSGWEPVSAGTALDFSMAAAFDGPGLEKAMEEHGLSPRRFWFGQGRVKPGDALDLEGDLLQMLGFRKSSGKVTLTFEKSEAVHGHPCGVFAVSGNASAEISGMPGSGEGRAEVGIESGKVWLSMLYPVVMREEIDGVISIRSGKLEEKNLSRTDGRASFLIERDWKIAAKED